MRLSARARANRLNAKRSTGPRTAAGKARVAENAFSHGLAVPITQTPGVEARIEEMARVIAGEGAEAGRLELARRVAEAQLDLVRIQEARRRLFEDPKARHKTLSKREAVSYVQRLRRQAGRMAAGSADELECLVAVDRMERLFLFGDARVGDPPSLVEGLGVLAPQLLRLERYERRATSRRKAAMRAYDTYCAGQEKLMEGASAPGRKASGRRGEDQN